MIKVKEEWIKAINYAKNKKDWNYTDLKLIKTQKEMIDTNFQRRRWDVDDENVKSLNEIKDLGILIDILSGEYEIELSDEETLIKTHRYYSNKKLNEYDIGFLQGLEYAMDKLKFKY